MAAYDEDTIYRFLNPDAVVRVAAKYPQGRPLEPFRHRLYRRIKVAGPDECWLWTGFIMWKGYGEIGVGHTVIRVHIAAWIIANGRLPGDGMFICHTCDVRHCCNPSHLFEGTPQDNMTDMYRKGRARPHGVRQPAREC